MLRAVLFDLDNTLVDREFAFRECVRRHFQEPAICDELFRLDAGGHGPRDVLFAAWQRHGGGAMDQDRFGVLISERITRDPELLSAMDVLSQTMKLGIVSNGGSSTQRRKLHAAGLSEIIPHDWVVISGEVGLAKPERGIFLLASTILDVLPENCLHLGDHEVNDLGGAKAAGMRAHLVGSVLNAESLKRHLKEEGH